MCADIVALAVGLCRMSLHKEMRRGHHCYNQSNEWTESKRKTASMRRAIEEHGS